MRAPDRQPGGAARLDLRAIRRQAELGELAGHAVDPRGAVGAPRGEPFGEARVGVVDAVAEDVEVLAELVDGRDLDGRHDRDPVLLGGGHGLADAVDRVVIGEREQLHAGRGCGRHDHGGFERAVGARRVRLQVEVRRLVV